MVAIAAMWQAIGVKTDTDESRIQRALQAQVRAKNYDVARWMYFASFGDASSFLNLLGSRNPNNWPGWANEKYDALLERSDYTRDPAERGAILREAETLMMKEYPVIPIYYSVGRRLVSPRVKGWIDSPRGATPTRFLVGRNVTRCRAFGFGNSGDGLSEDAVKQRRFRTRRSGTVHQVRTRPVSRCTKSESG